MKKCLGLVMVLGLVLALGNVAMAADSADVSVTANVVGTCRFQSTPTLDFGDLDQTVGTDATTTGDLVFWCTRNAAYTLSDEGNVGVADGSFSGNLANGPETIPYSISYTNFSGNGSGRTVPITSALTATILNADYVDAPEGVYNDVVTFTITP